MKHAGSIIFATQYNSETEEITESTMACGKKYLDVLKDKESIQDIATPDLLKQITCPNCLLKCSSNPGILAGHGIRAANAQQEFLQLIEKLQLPVMTTWRGSDLIDHNHPLFFGRPGLLSWNKAEQYLKECDLLICLGCRMDLMQTCWNPSTYYPNAKKVIVDIDQAELDKLPDGRKCGNCKGINQDRYVPVCFPIYGVCEYFEAKSNSNNWIKICMDAGEFINELI